jgi:hypothetical protein
LLLALAVAAQALYLARRLLFEGWLRRTLAAALGAELDAEVSIGTITGSWLRGATLTDVQIRGAHAPLTLDGGIVEVALSPVALLTEGLGGLRWALVRAGSAVVRTAPGGPAAAAAQESSSPDFAAIGRVVEAIFPRGASILVERFAFETGDDRRVGPLQARLRAGTGARELQVRFGADRIDAQWSPGRGFRARGRVDAPGALLRSLGVALPLTDGSLSFEASLTPQPLLAAARAEVDNARWDGEAIDACRLDAQCDPTSLVIRDADVRLTGVALRAQHMVLPNPIGTAFDLRRLRGDVELALERFAPRGTWVPDELEPHLPLDGNVRAWVHDGFVHLRPSNLRSASASVALTSGALPLADDPRRWTGRLGFRADVATPTTFGPVTVAGTASGAVRGSLSAAELDASFDVTDARLDELRAERLRGRVAFAAGTFRFRDVVCEGLRHSEEALPTDAKGTVAVRLATVAEPVELEAELDGTAAPQWLASVSIPDELRPGAPVRVAVRGKAVFGERPTADATLRLENVRIGALAPMVLTADAALRAEEIELRDLQIAGPITASLEGTVPLAETAEFALTVGADVPLETLIGRSLDARGRTRLRARVGGTLATPTLELELDAQATAFFAANPNLWPLPNPPAGDLRTELALRMDRTGTRIDRVLATVGEDGSIVLELAGNLPLRWSPTGGWHSAAAGDAAARPLRGNLRARLSDPRRQAQDLEVGSDLELGPHRLTLTDVHIATAEGGSLRGTAGAALGAADLVRPEGWPQAELDGSIELEAIGLEQCIPASLVGLSQLAGELTGRVSLSGTIGDPRPELDLHLAKGAVKIPGLARIEGIDATLAATPERAELRALSATMGAGKLSARGTLAAARGAFWREIDKAAVDVSVEGEDVLMIRGGGLKLRGNPRLQLSGTPENLLLAGRFEVTSGKFLRRQTLLPDLRMRGGETRVAGFVPFSIAPPLGERLRFDVEAETKEPFVVATHVFDSELSGRLLLRGPAVRPYLEGTVSGNSGRLRMPGATLDIASVLVSGTENHPFAPELNLLAEGRRHGVRVTLQVRGRFPDFEIDLTSAPALPRDDILVLLTTGVLPARLRDAGPQERAQLLGSYLATELLALYYGSDSTEREEGFASRFDIEYGSEISKNGLESIVVEFSLTDHLALQAERDVYEDYNMGIVLRVRF